MYKIILLFSIFLSSTSFAQSDDEYKGIRISWEPNPPAEQVAWYIIEMFNGSTDGWQVTDNTSESDYSIRFDALSQKHGVNIQIGSEMCFRIIAAKGNERSEPSEQTCIVWEKKGTGPVDPVDPTTNLTKPSQATLSLY